MAENAVTQRLRRLQQLYREGLPPDVRAGLCLWIVQPDEIDMIDALVLTEDTTAAVFQDLFLTFVSPFDSLRGPAGAQPVQQEQGTGGATRHYLESLQTEWQAQLDGAEADLLEQGADLTTASTPNAAPTLPAFCRRLLDFTKQLEHLHGRTVVYLRPESCADPAAFATLLEETLRAGLPDGLLLMAHATEEAPLARRLADRSDRNVITLRPDLNMAGVAAELAASGDPNDPAVRYRTLFLALSEHGSQGAFGRMKETGAELYAFTQQQAGWEHLLATILAAQGAHLLTAKRHRREALDFFRRARKDAELAVRVDNPAGRAVLLQTLGFEAAGQYHLGEYAAAAIVYRELAVLAAADDADAFHEMEALRMAGHCLERAGAPADAWDQYREGLSAAAKLSPDVLRGSTLPYLGRDLLRLVDELNRHAASAAIRDRMNELVGADWESLLEKAQTPAPQ